MWIKPARSVCPFCGDADVEIVGTAYGAPGCATCVNVCVYYNTADDVTRGRMGEKEWKNGRIILHAMWVQAQLWRSGVKDSLEEPK